MINIAIKIAASGWPAGIETQQQKDDYCRDYFEREGIILKQADIKLNPGLRALGKLFANSINFLKLILIMPNMIYFNISGLWGRLGLTLDKLQTKIIDNTEMFYEYLLDDTLDIKNFDLVGLDKVMVQYKVKDGYKVTNGKANVVVAAFVAMWGRLFLLEIMLKLGERVLYTDTDSVLFLMKPGQYAPPLGSMIGDFVDEIAEKYGLGVYITEYVGLAPKAYAVRLSNGEAIIKIKGVTLNVLNSAKITFDTLKVFVEFMIENNITPEPITTENMLNFIRDKSAGQIFNKPNQKKMGFSYTKRVCCDDSYITYPYGYLK